MSVEAIAGFTAAGATLLGLAVGAFFWLLSLIRSESRAARSEAREDNARLRTEMREDNARLREELLTEIREGNRGILEALYYHRHDPDGTAAFYPPQAAD